MKTALEIARETVENLPPAAVEDTGRRWAYRVRVVSMNDIFGMPDGNQFMLSLECNAVLDSKASLAALHAAVKAVENALRAEGHAPRFRKYQKSGYFHMGQFCHSGWTRRIRVEG